MRLVAAVLGLALVSSACTTGAGAATTDSEAIPVPATTATAPASDPVALASGTFEIPAASAFGEPGFHEVTMATARLPATIPEGTTLVVRLFDAGRPGQTCDSDHPLSGCVTIDWSDFEDRPNVPAGGVFDNHVALETASGPLTLFLSETGVLATVPDAYSPG